MEDKVPPKQSVKASQHSPSDQDAVNREFERIARKVVRSKPPKAKPKDGATRKSPP